MRKILLLHQIQLDITNAKKCFSKSEHEIIPVSNIKELSSALEEHHFIDMVVIGCVKLEMLYKDGELLEILTDIRDAYGKEAYCYMQSADPRKAEVIKKIKQECEEKNYPIRFV